jgi:hypothetical protein
MKTRSKIDAVRSRDDWTARTLMGLVEDLRELDESASRVRILIHILAKEHGVSIPQPSPSAAPPSFA